MAHHFVNERTNYCLGLLLFLRVGRIYISICGSLDIYNYLRIKTGSCRKD